MPELDQEQKEIISKLEEKIQHIIEETNYTSSKKVYFTQSEGLVLSLGLSNLNLKELPDEVEKLIELIAVDFSRNLLTQIPMLLLKLPKLAVLDLSYNQITRIPNWIEKFSLLRDIKLNNNQLYTIPRTIEGCRIVRRIYLQNNQIHSLPRELLELKLLEELHLDFRASMHKTTKGILAQLESKGCKIKNDYNRR
ncbi:MAG: leucine-rich repeat domain-containing protein [Candidatus Heimdallarchaeota archaeon]|nr:leucine-rich repeat domain-containing protein [Candidatus Heimdallarchaeota archaeon]